MSQTYWVTEIISKFAALGVTVEMLGDHLGKPKSAWLPVDRDLLLDIYEVIEDGWTSVAEVFGGEPTKA